MIDDGDEIEQFYEIGTESDARCWQSEPNTRRIKKSTIVNTGKTNSQASAADVRRSVMTEEFPSRSHHRSFIKYHGPLKHR